MDSVVFKNINVLFREELFGGIAHYKSQLFYLNKPQFKLLSEFKGYKQYSLLTIKEKEIIDEFLKYEIFLRIVKTN